MMFIMISATHAEVTIGEQHLVAILSLGNLSLVEYSGLASLILINIRFMLYLYASEIDY